MTGREPMRPIDAIPALPSEPEQRALPRRGWWAILPRAIVTSAAIAAMLALAAPLFFTVDGWLLVPPLAALAAALALDGLVVAAAAAAAGVIAGSALAPLVSGLPWGQPSEWLPRTALIALAAAALAGASAFGLRVAPRLAPVLTAAALAVVLLAGWSYALGTVSTPAEDGTTVSLLFTSPPRVDKTSVDMVVYLNYVKRVREGQGYYRVVAETLQEANATGLRFDAASPLSYRMPTLYVMLAALPGPLAPFVAMMACGTLAALAAFALARRYGSPALALASAALVTAYFAGIAVSLNLLMPEPWAGGFGLVVVALLLETQTSARAGRLLVAAIAAAVVSALFRELGVAFLLLGLLVAAAGRRDLRRAWVAWAAALLLVAGVYAVHWSAAASIVRELGIPALVYLRSPWLHADGRGLAGSLLVMTYSLTAREATGWGFAAASWLGCLAAPRRHVERAILALSVLGGSALVAFLYPTGSSAGGRLAAGYWGGLLVPLLLACVPLALTILPGGRRPATETGDDATG